MGNPKEIFATVIVWIATIEGAIMIAAPHVLYWMGRKLIPGPTEFCVIGLFMIPLGHLLLVGIDGRIATMWADWSHCQK